MIGKRKQDKIDRKRETIFLNLEEGKDLQNNGGGHVKFMLYKIPQGRLMDRVYQFGSAW